MTGILYGIGWLLVFYFIPALFFTWLSYCLTSPIRPLLIRKSFLIAGLTLAWAPGLMGGGHGVYIGQMFIGVVVMMPGNFKAILALQNVVLILVTLLIVSLLVVRSTPSKKM